MAKKKSKKKSKKELEQAGNDKIKSPIWTPNIEGPLPKTVGLDTATHCGFAYTNGDILLSGVWWLEDGLDEKHMKFVKLRAHLRKIHEEYGIEHIAFEAVRNSNQQGRAIICQSELQGNIKHFCDVYGISYSGYSPTEIKKHLTGFGGASKDDMVANAEKIYGFKPLSEDEADALGVLDFHFRNYII